MPFKSPGNVNYYMHLEGISIFSSDLQFDGPFIYFYMNREKLECAYSINTSLCWPVQDI